MNKMFNFSKNKEELYEWATEIFENTNNIDTYDDMYDFWVIGVRYKNEVFFEYDIMEHYDTKDKYWNYFKNHDVNDIDFIYIFTEIHGVFEIYISKHINDLPDTNDINTFAHFITHKYAINGKYINLIDDEEELIND